MLIYNTFRCCLVIYFVLAMNVLLDTPGGTGLYLSFNTTSWLMVTILITLGAWQVAHTKTFCWQSFYGYALVAVMLLTVPFFYDSPFKDHNILRLIGVAGGVLLLMAFNQFPALRKQNRQLLYLVLLAALLQSLVTGYQFLLAEPNPNSWFNPSKQRPFGLFLQPNIMASFLATAVAICLFLLGKTPYKKFTVALLSLLICWFSFLIPATRSLTGYYGLIIALILALPWLWQRRKLLAIAQVILVLAAYNFAQHGVITNSPNQAPSTDRNVEVRKDIYLISTQMILAKPLTGYGYGQFERAYLDFHNDLKAQDPTINAPLHRLDHPHNELLFWAVEGGIVAILAILLVVVGYVRLFTRFNLTKRMALFALIAPISFHALVELPFDGAASHWHILMLLLFITANECRARTTNISLPSGLMPATLAILVAGVFVPFLLTTMHTTAIVIAHEASNHQKIATFKQIINPLPLRERINANLNAHKLIVGFRDKNPEMLTQFVKWAQLQVQHKPREKIYRDLLLSLKVLGREQDYLQVLKEAQSTYPEVADWRSDLSKPTFEEAPSH